MTKSLIEEVIEMTDRMDATLEAWVTTFDVSLDETQELREEYRALRQKIGPILVASTIIDNDEPEKPQLDIYPLTVCKDRYGGTYSGGNYTVWNLDSDCVSSAIHSDDLTCSEFWENNHRIFGKGSTIDEAIGDLERKLEQSSKSHG